MVSREPVNLLLHRHLQVPLRQLGTRVLRLRFEDGKPSSAPFAVKFGPLLTIDSGTRNGERYNEDILIDRETTDRRGRGHDQDVEITRRRSMSNVRNARSKKDMWTEVTKDLVIKEAIDEMGYDYEETEDFFYVIDYLRYVSFCTHPSKTSATHQLTQMGL